MISELELQLYVEVGNDLWWYFLLLRCMFKLPFRERKTKVCEQLLWWSVTEQINNKATEKKDDKQQLTAVNARKPAQKWQIFENSLISRILQTPELTMSSKLTEHWFNESTL